jgi:hypothetical protein
VHNLNNVGKHQITALFLFKHPVKPFTGTGVIRSMRPQTEHQQHTYSHQRCTEPANFHSERYPFLTHINYALLIACSPPCGNNNKPPRAAGTNSSGKIACTKMVFFVWSCAEAPVTAVYQVVEKVFLYRRFKNAHMQGLRCL